MQKQFLHSLTAKRPGVYLAIITLLLQFGVNLSGGYGYFRDEFYYIACSNNLALGYVDHPSLSILILWLQRTFLGNSIFALRFLPAVATAGLVYLTALIVRELGGGKKAELLACLSVVFAPVYLAVSSFYSMNVFEPLFWVGSTYILIRILNTGNEKLWLLFGIVAGLGIQNKHSMLFFGFALLVSILLTPQRKIILNKWFWIAGAVAFIIAVPNIVWQMTHDWATLEFMQNAQQWKNTPLSPIDFFSSQILFQHPFILPVWFTGLVALLFYAPLKRYRFLGITYLLLFILFVVQRGKPYYLSPIYPLLLVTGALFFEQFTIRKNWKYVFYGYLTFLIVFGLVTFPLWTPILPVETYIKYSTALGMQPPKMERGKDSVLPQVFADRFGWKEMVAKVAEAYNSLTPEEKREAVIYTQNYGEAGAVDFFGKKYNLPKAISGHNNYWLWGFHNYSGNVVIVIGGGTDSHSKVFESVELFTIHKHEYAMPFENEIPIFICKKPNVQLKDIWRELKRFI